jgi:hypothetical protein
LVRSIAIASGILALAGVENASAQIVDPAEFTTSFPFRVGNATVPAGRYTIRQDNDNPEILELTGAHTFVFFQAESATARETPSKPWSEMLRVGAASKSGARSMAECLVQRVPPLSCGRIGAAPWTKRETGREVSVLKT